MVEQELKTITADTLHTFLKQVGLPRPGRRLIPTVQHPPERANDSPTVAASVDLELVGVRVMKRRAISQPEHIRGVFFFSPCAFQGAVHDNRLAQ